VKILFVNTPAERCSIHELGAAAHEILADGFDMEYMESRKPSEVVKALERDSFGCVIVNHHCVTNPDMNVHTIPGIPLVGFHSEMLQDDPYVGGRTLKPGAFHAVAVPDPTLKCKDRDVFAVPRPIQRLERFTDRPPRAVPWIGFHGFIHLGKSGAALADAVNAEFTQAVVRVHSPKATHVQNYPERLKEFVEGCSERLNPGIELRVTTEYFDRRKLLEWVAENDVACFHYTRDVPGLAAVSDQAISAGTPMSVCGSAFRHVLRYQRPWPDLSIRGSLEVGRAALDAMRRAWAPELFRAAFSAAIDYAVGPKARLS
jgi:hypothetical protein